MIRIGVTGGIGMGKSSASEFLAHRGVPIIDSDILAREMVKPGSQALLEIHATFGPGMLTPQGELDRTTLAAKIFGDEEARKKLESILHPRIRSAWSEQIRMLAEEGRATTAAVVIPLLFETGAQASFDKIICVASSAGTQKKRLLQRGLSEVQIQARNAAQWPVSKKMDLSDFVLWNDGSLDVLGQQIDLVFASLPHRQGETPTGVGRNSVEP